MLQLVQIAIEIAIGLSEIKKTDSDPGCCALSLVLGNVGAHTGT